MKAKLVKDVFVPFLGATEAYKNETHSRIRQEMEKGAFDAFVATCYLRRSDRSKFQSLIDDL